MSIHRDQRPGLAGRVLATVKAWREPLADQFVSTSPRHELTR